MELNEWQTDYKEDIDSLSDEELSNKIIEFNKKDSGGPHSIKNWWGYKYAVAEYEKRKMEKTETTERKYKEYVDSLTNEELFNKILDNHHGDDYEGRFTDKGWWKFNLLVTEYAKRMEYKLYNWSE